MGASLTIRQQQNQALDNVRTRMTKVKDRLFEGAPRHISAERMITTTLIALRDNPDLLKCEIDSLLSAVRQAAFYGWEIGGVLAQAYLVPYRDNKRGTSEAVLIPGYRGLIDLVRRTKEISQIDMEVVHAVDRFRVTKGDESSIFHEPSDQPDRIKSPITHVYVIVHFLTGARQRSVWTTSEIDWHKESFSQAWARAEKSGKKDSPWHTHWKTMAFKTVIIDMIKRGQLPVSGEIRESIQKEDRVVGGQTVISEVPPPAIRYDEPQEQLKIENGGDETHEARQGTSDPLDTSEAPTALELAYTQVDECTGLQEVTDVVIAHQELLSKEGFKELEEYAETARERIRAARGERANKKD